MLWIVGHLRCAYFLAILPRDGYDFLYTEPAIRLGTYLPPWRIGSQPEIFTAENAEAAERRKQRS